MSGCWAGQAAGPPHPPYTCPSPEPHPAPSPLMAMVTAGPGRISTIFTNHSEAWAGGADGLPRGPTLFATQTPPSPPWKPQSSLPFHPEPSVHPGGPAGVAGLPPPSCPKGPGLGTGGPPQYHNDIISDNKSHLLSREGFQADGSWAYYVWGKLFALTALPEIL